MQICEKRYINKDLTEYKGSPHCSTAKIHLPPGGSVCETNDMYLFKHSVGSVNIFTGRYVKEQFDHSRTLLFDLSYLAYCLFKDGTFVWLYIEAVDVAKVGRNQFGEFLDVLALLFPPAFITPVEHKHAVSETMQMLNNPDVRCIFHIFVFLPLPWCVTCGELAFPV